MQLAPLSGDGLAPAGRAQPDGGGDVQGPLRAAAAAAPALRRRPRTGFERLKELANEEVDLDGVAGMPGGGGVRSLDDQAWALHAVEQPRHAVVRLADGSPSGVGERLGCGL